MQIKQLRLAFKRIIKIVPSQIRKSVFEVLKNRIIMKYYVYLINHILVN